MAILPSRTRAPGKMTLEEPVLGAAVAAAASATTAVVVSSSAPAVAPSGGKLVDFLMLNRGLFVRSSLVLFPGIVAMYVLYRIAQSLDPTAESRAEVDKKSKETLIRMKRGPLKLNEHERTIMNEVVMPDDIKIKFSNIGGLDHIIAHVKESILFPLKHPDLFGNELLRPPKGVLLYGPPGCGKTMLAQAIAKECDATFINLRVSTLTEKWFGESQKLVKAVFTLAHKLQPAIVFIDEIDSFLRERSSSDHETIGMMKAEFMSLWDGLKSGDNRILILGATNRAAEIDKAILRRMPKVFQIGLPTLDQRLSILTLTLAGQELDDNIDLAEIARRTDGYSGSDLKELCRNAAMAPLRDYLRENEVSLSASSGDSLVEGAASNGSAPAGKNGKKRKLRKLAKDDFFGPEQSEGRQTYEDIMLQKSLQGVLRNLQGIS